MTSFALPLRSAPGGFFLFFFLLNCLLSVGALSYGRQESDVLLPSGVYAIINRVLSPDDERLAITFNGEDETVTVTAWTNDTTQQWVIADYDTTTQSVSPASSQDLQAAWGDDVVTVLSAGSYVWTIRNNNTGYTIQDGGVTVFWGVAEAVDDANVTIGAGTGNDTQRWLFESV